MQFNFNSLNEQENKLINDFIDDFTDSLYEPFEVKEVNDNGIVYYDYDTSKDEFMSVDDLLYNAKEYEKEKSEV